METSLSVMKLLFYDVWQFDGIAEIFLSEFLINFKPFLVWLGRRGF